LNKKRTSTVLQQDTGSWTAKKPTIAYQRHSLSLYAITLRFTLLPSYLQLHYVERRNSKSSVRITVDIT